MEPTDLLTLTRRMLDQLELDYGVVEDEGVLIAAGDDDQAITIGTGTVDDSKTTSIRR